MVFCAVEVPSGLLMEIGSMSASLQELEEVVGEFVRGCELWRPKRSNDVCHFDRYARHIETSEKGTLNRSQPVCLD